MAPRDATQVEAARPGPYRAAQTRIIDAALDLFAEHGVGGTSLQMIAERIGVTKAAVYHQFPTKDEIVIAAAGAELDRVVTVVEAAEAEPDPVRAREVAVAGMVDLAVERRRMESSLLGDPVIVRYFGHHEPFRQVMDRLYRLLAGEGADPEARVPAAMLTAAIGGAVMHPLAADLDDETLRTELVRLATRFLDPLPPQPTGASRPGRPRPE
jgi:AcrR family transcriptional regulator